MSHNSPVDVAGPGSPPATTRVQGAEGEDRPASDNGNPVAQTPPDQTMLAASEPRISELRNDEAWTDERLRATWRTLWAQTAGATHFQTWEWQYNYWRYLTKRARTFLLTVGEPEPSVLGVFCQVRDKHSYLRKTTFVGDIQADYHMLLARPDVPESTGAQAISEFIKHQGARVSFVDFSNVPESSWTGRVLKSVLQEQHTKHYRFAATSTYAVELPKTFDEYLGRLGDRTRRAFAYDRRRLLRQHDVRFEVFANADERCLSAIESIDKARWGDASNFHRRDLREFEHAAARALSELRLFLAAVLYVDGRPVAYIHGAVVDSKWLIPRIGYDRGISSKLSVGKVANFYAVEHAVERGFQLYDLTRGGEDYKKWLGATARTNLQLRFYRTSMDRWLDRTMAPLLESVRRNQTLRSTYLRLRKEVPSS